MNFQRTFRRKAFPPNRFRIDTSISKCNRFPEKRNSRIRVLTWNYTTEKPLWEFRRKWCFRLTPKCFSLYYWQQKTGRNHSQKSPKKIPNRMTLARWLYYHTTESIKRDTFKKKQNSSHVRRFSSRLISPGFRDGIGRTPGNRETEHNWCPKTLLEASKRQWLYFPAGNGSDSEKGECYGAFSNNRTTVKTRKSPTEKRTD